MTLAPMMKICPKCKKMYSFNPDVGQFMCPHCGGIGKKTENPLKRILRKDADEKD